MKTGGDDGAGVKLLTYLTTKGSFKRGEGGESGVVPVGRV